MTGIPKLATFSFANTCLFKIRMFCLFFVVFYFCCFFFFVVFFFCLFVCLFFSLSVFRFQIVNIGFYLKI